MNCMASLMSLGKLRIQGWDGLVQVEWVIEVPCYAKEIHIGWCEPESPRFKSLSKQGVLSNVEKIGTFIWSLGLSWLGRVKKADKRLLYKFYAGKPCGKISIRKKCRWGLKNWKLALEWGGNKLRTFELLGSLLSYEGFYVTNVMIYLNLCMFLLMLSGLTSGSMRSFVLSDSC